jgi:hypothetical protein
MMPLDRSVTVLRLEVARILGSAPALWALALLGLSSPLWDRGSRVHLRFLGLFTFFSAAAVATGMRFSSHYFILLLPAASLWAGLGVSALASRLAEARPRLADAVRYGVPIAAVALSLASERRFLFVLPPFDLARSVYDVNPFPEALDVARYIREHSNPQDTIAVLGSEPEIYFYADRPAATTFIYMYPLMETHPYAKRMQEEMIAQIEAARPRFVVLVNVDTSWSMQVDSHDQVLRWSEKFVNEGYEPVGLVDIVPDGPTIAWWGDGAKVAEPQSQSRVFVFERRP